MFYVLTGLTKKKTITLGSRIQEIEYNPHAFYSFYLYSVILRRLIFKCRNNLLSYLNPDDNRENY